MLDKKINLEQILKDNCVNIRFLKTMLSADGIKGSQGQRILDAMKDLSEQILELAAENAEMILLVDEENDIIEEASINKQSILDTINQVE